MVLCLEIIVNIIVILYNVLPKNVLYLNCYSNILNKSVLFYNKRYSIFVNMSDNKEELKTTLHRCLSEQISEIELFKSMYPNCNELILSNSDIVNITKFINGETGYVPKHLDFTLHVKVNEYKLEISVNLSGFYPIEVVPDVNVRCNQLNRYQETCLNSELLKFITDNHSGEVYLLTIISWIQEYVEGLEDLKSIENNVQIQKNIEENDKFIRIWIFSHHIYSKKKREQIVKLAKDLDITGFCLPGKPGIICVEGSETNCNAWWKVIKSLSWQKIGIRKTEIFNETERQEHQKFYDFEEIHFKNYSSKHSKHANMSEFSKYIEKHGLSPAFNEIFGLSM